MAPKFDWGIPVHRKYRISEFKNKKCKVLNTTSIASGFTGYDSQGGTSDESVLQVLVYLKWLKVLLCSCKEKEKESWSLS